MMFPACFEAGQRPGPSTKEVTLDDFLTYRLNMPPEYRISRFTAIQSDRIRKKAKRSQKRPPPKPRAHSAYPPSDQPPPQRVFARFETEPPTPNRSSSQSVPRRETMPSSRDQLELERIARSHQAQKIDPEVQKYFGLTPKQREKKYARVSRKFVLLHQDTKGKRAMTGHFRLLVRLILRDMSEAYAAFPIPYSKFQQHPQNYQDNSVVTRDGMLLLDPETKIPITVFVSMSCKLQAP